MDISKYRLLRNEIGEYEQKSRTLPVEKTKKWVNGEQGSTMIVDQNAVGEHRDVNGVVGVAGKRYGVAEGGSGVGWLIVALEIRLQITYAAVAL